MVNRRISKTCRRRYRKGTRNCRHKRKSNTRRKRKSKRKRRKGGKRKFNFLVKTQQTNYGRNSLGNQIVGYYKYLDHAYVLIIVGRDVFRKRYYQDLNKNFYYDIRLGHIYSQYDIKNGYMDVDIPRAPKGLPRKLLCELLKDLIRRCIINYNSIIVLEADITLNGKLMDMYKGMSFKTLSLNRTNREDFETEEAYLNAKKTYIGGAMYSTVGELINWCNNTYENIDPRNFPSKIRDYIFGPPKCKRTRMYQIRSRGSKRGKVNRRRKSKSKRHRRFRARAVAYEEQRKDLSRKGKFKRKSSSGGGESKEQLKLDRSKRRSKSSSKGRNVNTKELNFLVNVHGSMDSRFFKGENYPLNLKIPKEINPVILTNEIGVTKKAEPATVDNIHSLLSNYAKPEEVDALFRNYDPESIKDLYEKYLCEDGYQVKGCNVDNYKSITCKLKPPQFGKGISANNPEGKSYLYSLCDYKLVNMTNSINYLMCFMDPKKRQALSTGIWQVRSKDAPDPPQYNIFDQYLSQWMAVNKINPKEWPMKGNLVDYFTILVEWCNIQGYKDFKINIFLTACKEIHSPGEINVGDLVEYFITGTNQQVPGIFKVTFKYQPQFVKGKPRYFYDIQNITTGETFSYVPKKQIRKFWGDNEAVVSQDFDTMIDFNRSQNENPPSPPQQPVQVTDQFPVIEPPQPPQFSKEHKPGPWLDASADFRSVSPKHPGKYREPVPEFGMED